MKKRIIALLLCMTTVLSFCACGSDNKEKDTQEGTQEATATYNGPASVDMELDLEKLVKKMPDYKNIKVTITGDYDVTDEQVESNILMLLPYYGVTGIEVTDRDIVEEDDYVKIDYTGYKDDVAFEGGKAEDVTMDIKNNMDISSQRKYIDGFCDDLAGKKVGDEVDTNVTFPEDYGTADLAGQPAVFKIKIKGIYTPVTMENLTDDMVKEAFKEEKLDTNEKLETKEDLKKHVRNLLENQAANNKSQASLNEVQTYMLTGSEVEIPEEYLEARLAEYQASFEKNLTSSGQTMADYLKSNGTTMEDLKESWKMELQDTIKMEFVFGRIADLENVEIKEEDFKEFVQYIIDSSSGMMADETAVYEYYGAGKKENGEKMLRQMYRVNTALSQVVEDADITVEKPADTEEEENGAN